MAFNPTFGTPQKRLQMAGYKCVAIGYTKLNTDSASGALTVTGLNRIVSVDLTNASGAAAITGSATQLNVVTITGMGSETQGLIFVRGSSK